jgi:hypothetical protein
MPRKQTAGCHGTQIANKLLKSVAKLQYFGKIPRSKNRMREGKKNRLNLVNACYHRVPVLLSSSL